MDAGRPLCVTGNDVVLDRVGPQKGDMACLRLLRRWRMWRRLRTRTPIKSRRKWWMVVRPTKPAQSRLDGVRHCICIDSCAWRVSINAPGPRDDRPFATSANRATSNAMLLHFRARVCTVRLPSSVGGVMPLPPAQIVCHVICSCIPY